MVMEMEAQRGELEMIGDRMSSLERQVGDVNIEIQSNMKTELVHLQSELAETKVCIDCPCIFTHNYEAFI